MMMKRITAAIAGICLLITAAGCTSTPPASGTTSAAGASGSSEVSQPSAAPSGQPGGSGKQEITLTMMRDESATQKLSPDAPVLDAIFEATGVKIDLKTIPGSDYSTKCSTLLATGDLPDIMKITMAQLQQFVGSNVFVEISAYPDLIQDYQKVLDIHEQSKKLKVDGKLYSFNMIAKVYNRLFTAAPMIRMDYMEKYNLDAPKTFDDLFEILKRFKTEDPSSYPYTTRSGNIIDTLAYSMGSGWKMYYDYDIDGGKWVYGPAREEYLEVLEYCSRLYAEGVLDPDYVTNTNQQWQENLSSGKSSFFFDNFTFATNYNKALQSSDPNARFDLLDMPANSQGKIRAKTHPLINWANGNAWVISTKCKEIERAVSMLNWFYSEDGTLATNFGIEGQDYTMENGEVKISQARYDEAMKQSDPARGYMGNLGTGLFGISGWVDETTFTFFMDDLTLSWHKRAEEAGSTYSKENFIDPAFTEEEQEKVKEIKTKIDTLLDTDIHKYVMGQLPLSDFPALQEKMKAAGVEELEAIYNTAENR